KTVGKWLDTAKVDEKVRCQTPFRESTSWAAFLRRTDKGALLHDVGTGVSYTLKVNGHDVVEDRRERPQPTTPAPHAALLDATGDVLIDVNQDNVALVFAKRFGDQLRYSHDRGRWRVWDGTRWREETTRLAF